MWGTVETPAVVRQDCILQADFQSASMSVRDSPEGRLAIGADRRGITSRTLAHEEGLRFGACMPFEKELSRKDGTRVPVLVATAILKLSPFRWISFIQDLGEPNREEIPGGELVEVKVSVGVAFW